LSVSHAAPPRRMLHVAQCYEYCVESAVRRPKCKGVVATCRRCVATRCTDSLPECNGVQPTQASLAPARRHDSRGDSAILSIEFRTHATHAGTHARMHARTHARTRAQVIKPIAFPTLEQDLYADRPYGAAPPCVACHFVARSVAYASSFYAARCMRLLYVATRVARLKHR
jgi:hypothetical protein